MVVVNLLAMDLEWSGGRFFDEVQDEACDERCHKVYDRVYDKVS